MAKQKLNKMILTEKAKEDFEKWYSNGINDKEELYNIFDFYENKLANSCKNALIIEWFDSVGIYIEIGKDPINFLYIVHKGDYKKAYFKCGGFDTRQEATEEAIKKANEIYNKE